MKALPISQRASSKRGFVVTLTDGARETIRAREMRPGFDRCYFYAAAGDRTPIKLIAMKSIAKIELSTE